MTPPTSRAFAVFAAAWIIAAVAGAPVGGAEEASARTPTSAVRTAPAWFGFNDAGAMLRPQYPPKRGADLLATAGANTVRVTFDWRWAEPQPRRWRLSGYDTIYREAMQRGVRPIFVILFAPHWTWDDSVRCDQFSQNCKYPPGAEHEQAWRRLIGGLVRRYPRMAAVEVWNEPNLRFFWQSGVDPAHYAWMLKAAKEEVVHAGSSVPVIGGSTAPFTGVNWRGMDSADFLDEVYRHAGKDAIDGIGVHPYPSDVDDGRFHRELTLARSVRAAHRDDAPLWVTELGVSTTGGFTERQQAAILSRLRAKLADTPDVAATVLHLMVDVTKYRPGNSERGFGLLRGDFSPKPAWCALGGAAARTVGCLPRFNSGLGRLQDARWHAQDMLERAIDAAVRIRSQTGGYTAVTSSRLAAEDGALDSRPQRELAVPGRQADPRRIFVRTVPRRPMVVQLCNVSTADRSYCAIVTDGRHWRYGSARGGIPHAAHSATFGNGLNW